MVPKLSDSSRKFITKKQRKTMNDPFVERTEKTEIHQNPTLDENRAGRGTELNENRRLTSENTPVQKCHDFATSTGILD